MTNESEKLGCTNCGNPVGLVVGRDYEDDLSMEGAGSGFICEIRLVCSLCGSSYPIGRTKSESDFCENVPERRPYGNYEPDRVVPEGAAEDAALLGDVLRLLENAIIWERLPAPLATPTLRKQILAMYRKALHNAIRALSQEQTGALSNPNQDRP